MARVIIGVDPHKLSVTLEVVDRHERLLGSGPLTWHRTWPPRCDRQRLVRPALAGSGSPETVQPSSRRTLGRGGDAVSDLRVVRR